jgi:hypothetical protein
VGGQGRVHRVVRAGADKADLPEVLLQKLIRIAAGLSSRRKKKAHLRVDTPMMQFSSPTLIDLLRSTLRRLEENSELDPADPQLRELKGSILRSIAELEIQKTGDAEVEDAA